MQAPSLSDLGVYVHFPYCLQKCPYCDFVSVATERSAVPHAEYADRVIAELEMRAAKLGERRLRSVFFGGGTPSLWEPVELGRVLSAIRSRFSSGDAEPEISAECNPSSLDSARAEAILAQGVNRLSVGVQSLDARRLEFLGRLHDSEGGLRAVRSAIAAGAPRVSADFIFGVHGQTPEVATSEVLRIAETGVTHLSAYALTIEPGTVFGTRAKSGKLPLLGDDLVADSFLAIDEALTEAGFEHYEISNFARQGHRAEHNLGYWRGDDYLGLGTGAWGTVTRDGTRVRYRNTPSPERYLAGQDEMETEVIDDETALKERILLGLRLATGVDLGREARALGLSPWNPERERAAERLVKRGRLAREGDRLWVPKSAWLFADGTISELL
jgi:putative oxygen-independent coproporphyrinogen III oxidase